MSSRVHPRNPRAFNLYFSDNLVISESSASFLSDAADPAAKIALIQEYIKNLFNLRSAPAISMQVVTDRQEYYRFEDPYHFFISN